LDGYGSVRGDEYGILIGLLIGIGLAVIFLGLMYYLFGKKNISDIKLSTSKYARGSSFFLAILLISDLFQRF